MGALSPWHWLVVVVIGMVVLGFRKLPERMRDLGKTTKNLQKASEE